MQHNEIELPSILGFGMAVLSTKCQLLTCVFIDQIVQKQCLGLCAQMSPDYHAVQQL